MAADVSTACLLLHGFAGSTFEVAPLAPPLEALGLTVEMPLLPGHGESLADFRRTFFPDWLDAAEQRFDALAATHERVFVGGFSMGGALSLILGARRRPAGIMALATPLWLYRIIPRQVRDLRLPFLPLLQYVTPVIPMPARGREAQEIAPCDTWLEGLPLAQLRSLGQGLALARRGLPLVSAPLLIIQDSRDRSVGPDAAGVIAGRALSLDVTMRRTNARENITGKHMITTHRETRAEVAGLCADFVRRVAGMEKNDI